jgi:hypothetical protein
MNIPRKPLSEITNQAIEILFKGLGSADAIRFLNQYTNGHGNYTLERDALFEWVTLDEVLHEIKQKENNEGS